MVSEHYVYKFLREIRFDFFMENGFDAAEHHTPQIRELIDKLAVHCLSIISKTKNIGDDHAAEINDYIAKHHFEQDQCIVIDDDPGIFRTK